MERFKSLNQYQKGFLPFLFFLYNKIVHKIKKDIMYAFYNR